LYSTNVALPIKTDKFFSYFDISKWVLLFLFLELSVTETWILFDEWKNYCKDWFFVWKTPKRIKKNNKIIASVYSGNSVYGFIKKKQIARKHF
jgi:hypothetical protein